MLVSQRDKLNPKQYHVGDKNGPDFSLSEGLISFLWYPSPSKSTKKVGDNF